MSLRRNRSRSALALQWAALGGLPWIASAAEPGNDFAYRTQAKDTLIGLGARLLLQPRQWRQLQTDNRIRDPRRIPIGTTIRIPYEWLRLRPAPARLIAAAGGVTRDGRPAAVGDEIGEGGELATDANGSASLRLADGSVMTLQKSSVLGLEHMRAVVGAPGFDIRLTLRSGRLDTAVQPHRDVGRFEIRTPVAVSAVRGTQFRSSFAAAAGAATTETLDGVVAVSGTGATIALPANFGTRVESDRPPLEPVPLLPPPELSAVPAINSHGSLHAAFEPIAGAAGYRVQLARDAAFASIDRDVVVGTAAVDLADLPDGRFWLRVRAIDGLALEGRDAIREFQQRRLPDPPAPAMPAPGARVFGDRARFEWTAGATGVRYHFQLARDRSFAVLSADRSGLEVPFVEVGGLEPGDYAWRVAAQADAMLEGSWSEAATYGQRAAAPALAAPMRVKRRLHWVWPSRPGEKFVFEAARTPDFAKPLLEQTVEDPEVWMPVPFPGTYYARLKVVDAGGEAGPYGTPFRFQVPVPLWVKILIPIVLVSPFL